MLCVVGYFFFIHKNTENITNIPAEITLEENSTKRVIIIGESAGGRPITAYSFGSGETDILFVGGIHGGYEWNSVVLAEAVIAALENNEITVPQNIRVHIIPNLNPDGTYAVLGMTDSFTSEQANTIASSVVSVGRFNDNSVDINRNFPCNWQPTSTWRGQTVNAGNAAFSEPEAIALRDYVFTIEPQAVAFWHSQANTVYASECREGVLPQTKLLMEAYARAADYREAIAFDSYPISGDAEGWLASIGIPAISVELETRNQIEWVRNKAGIEAVFDLYIGE